MKEMKPEGEEGNSLSSLNKHFIPGQERGLGVMSERV